VAGGREERGADLPLEARLSTTPQRMDIATQSVSVVDSAGRLHADVGAIPLLDDLPRTTREALLQDARIERFAPSARIFGEAEIPQHLYVVLGGIIDLSCSYKRNECTALLLVRGDVFMPAAALYEEPYLVAAGALTPARLLLIDAETVREQTQRCPRLALGIARIMAGQWRVALKIILDLKCRSPSQRLAAFLLRLHDARSTGSIAEVPFSKRQLASRIGMQPETLSRTLQTLAANGLYLRGREIIVSDRAEIERFCGPAPYPFANEYELGVHAL
jgi:CRP/FNR family transcriptional regulator, transcriptional activator FtrB